jgi:diguanylate cyclase (GGDEF)-like protein
MGHPSSVSHQAGQQHGDNPLRRRPPRVLLTWALLGICILLLIGRGFVEFLSPSGGPMDLVLAMAVAALVAIAVINARISGIEAERLHSEAESFTSILRALSRSLSPDAVVESIVHELGTATSADHVAVVKLRPGSSSLDVTFVSMLPGTPSSNTVMSLRALEPDERRHPRELPGPRPAATSWRLAYGEPRGVRRGEGPAGAQAAATTSLRNVRGRPRALDSVGTDANAHEVADRIAYRLRDAYGLRNTLAAPLQAGRSIAGAIVLSRRTEDEWPDAAVRLLNSAASEASAALARVYSLEAAEVEARTDQLTQLPNRRYFDEYCRLLASRRRSADRVAIIAIDVDHFKKLNDQYGHQVGDVALRAIANAIQLSVREEDVPARFGGEEFVVLLRNPSPGYAMEIGERIRENVRDLTLIDAGVTERVTVSVGVATAEHSGEPIEEIVERADQALYSAKRSGRDRVVEAWHSASGN